MSCHTMAKRGDKRRKRTTPRNVAMLHSGNNGRGNKLKTYENLKGKLVKHLQTHRNRLAVVILGDDFGRSADPVTFTDQDSP
jgi:hypothetical protein